MIDFLLGFLILLLVGTAAFALFTDKLLNSIITLSLFSALMVIILIVLKAPDLALAEAVIAAGIMTSFFVVTIDKTEGV